MNLDDINRALGELVERVKRTDWVAITVFAMFFAMILYVVWSV